MRGEGRSCAHRGRVAVRWWCSLSPVRRERPAAASRQLQRMVAWDSAEGNGRSHVTPARAHSHLHDQQRRITTVIVRACTRARVCVRVRVVALVPFLVAAAAHRRCRRSSPSPRHSAAPLFARLASTRLSGRRAARPQRDDCARAAEVRSERSDIRKLTVSCAPLDQEQRRHKGKEEGKEGKHTREGEKDTGNTFPLHLSRLHSAWVQRLQN